MPRLSYHFEPKLGWSNDPNGLVYFKGKYHAFFQHNPYDTSWGKMHWGHAVSDDLLHWEELPIALYPDMPYEDKGGCFSGSAVVKDGRLYLFYTAVSEALEQTQCVAYSDDGVTFTKYEGNPIIDRPPVEGSVDFRDPKVTKIGDTYYMVVGTGKDGVGKVVFYTSKDLFHWDYAGVLFEERNDCRVIECPDFFELDGKFVLVYSIRLTPAPCVGAAIGSFDGKTFVPERIYRPEHGPHFYAPQSFTGPNGERIQIAWMHHFSKRPAPQGYVGAFSIPRELHVKDGKLISFPVASARPHLTESDPLVTVDASGAVLHTAAGELKSNAKEITSLHILRDTKTVEVFVNGGEETFTYWFDQN